MSTAWMRPTRLPGESMDAFLSRRIRACRHLGKAPDARLSTCDLDELIAALGADCPKGLRNLRAALQEKYGQAPAWTTVPIEALSRLLRGSMSKKIKQTGECP